MFDWLGFAHLDGTTTGMTTYSDFTEFAVPYQVADPTVYEKNTGKIESLGIKTIVVDNAEMIANYVIVYKAEDKWTRVAEDRLPKITTSATNCLPEIITIRKSIISIWYSRCCRLPYIYQRWYFHS